MGQDKIVFKGGEVMTDQIREDGGGQDRTGQDRTGQDKPNKTHSFLTIVMFAMSSNFSFKLSLDNFRIFALQNWYLFFTFYPF